MFVCAISLAAMVLTACANGSGDGRYAGAVVTEVMPAVASRVQDTSSTQTLTLAEAIQQLAKTNPMVHSARLRWEAMLNRRSQATALPDPKVEGTVFNPEDDEEWMLGITQELPWPGKLMIAGKIADKEAQAEYLKYAVVMRDAVSETKVAWWELWYLDHAESVTRKIEALYARYAALAAGGVKLGETNLPETFRAEAQRAQLGYDVIRLREIREVESARLRELTGIAKGTTIEIASDGDANSEQLAPVSELQAVAETYNQELRAAGIELDRMREELRLARRQAIPDFMVGLRYTRMVVPDLIEPGMSAPENPIGYTLGFTVPIWPRKYVAMAREARLNAEAAELEVNAAGRKLQSDLARAYYDAVNSDRLVQLYETTLIPQSRQALQSAEELFRTGSASMASILETTATVHNFELARLRAIADRAQNRARLEQVTGRALGAVAREKGDHP